MRPLYKIDLNSKLESRKTLPEKPLGISSAKKKKKRSPQKVRKKRKWKPIFLSLFFCLSVRKNTVILVFCQHRIFYPFFLAIHSSNFCVINLQIETFYLPSFIQEISGNSSNVQISWPHLANCPHTPKIYYYCT